MKSKKGIAVILTLILVLGMMAGCRGVTTVKEEKAAPGFPVPEERREEAIERPPVSPEEAISEVRPPIPPPPPAKEAPARPALPSEERQRAQMVFTTTHQRIIEWLRIERREVPPPEVVTKLGRAKKALEKDEYARVDKLCREISALLVPRKHKPSEKRIRKAGEIVEKMRMEGKEVPREAVTKPASPPVLVPGKQLEEVKLE